MRLIKNLGLLLFILVAAILISIPSCVHDPIEIPMPPIDTMVVNPPDTILGPCDGDSSYYNLQVQPIFTVSCATSGCHDATSAKDGIILDSYENTINTSRLVPGDAEDSELYTVLISTGGDKMPPNPASRLPDDEIQIIKTWIDQGALDLTCDTTICDTVEMSFARDILPITKFYCEGCHEGSSAGGGVLLTNYDEIKASADNGGLYGTIIYATGWSPMPRNSPKLDDCTISKIKSWIDDGANDN